MTTPLPARFFGENALKAFRENGFIKIPQAVSPFVLQQLGDALERLRYVKSHSDSSIIASDGKEYFINAGELCNRSEAIFLEILGSPLLLSLAETICGEDFFPIQEFAVIKNRGDENPVNWHQDVNNQSPGKTFMIGIYLDRADEDNGALRVVPGSQCVNESICVLEKLPSICISMEPGDILVHDLMIAHSSGLMKTYERRRVVYFEFMSAAQARSENIYPEEFINARTRLIPLAMKKFSAAYPAAEPFKWKHPHRERFESSGDTQKELEGIYQLHLKVKPANYCFDFLQQQAMK